MAGAPGALGARRRLKELRWLLSERASSMPDDERVCW